MNAPFITDAGLVCAVGIGSSPACAAMRAKLAGFGELPYFDGNAAILGAPVPGLAWQRSAITRLAALLDAAVAEVGERLDPPTRSELALVVVSGEPERGTLDEGRMLWLAELAIEALGEGPRPRSIHVLQGGAPACLRALALARALLREGQVGAVLVCGVDSLLDARSLAWLGAERPHRTTRRSDGTFAGEAAAALLLRATRAATRGPVLQLVGLGFGDEPSARDVSSPLRGEGLVTAMRAALVEAGVGLHEVGLRLADGGGDEVEAKEQVLALTRILRERVESMPIWLNGETLGRVGCASALVQLVRVLEAARGGYLPGHLALASAVARSGERAAALVRAC